MNQNDTMHTPPDPMKRRRFLTLLGAGAAGMAAGCAGTKIPIGTASSKSENESETIMAQTGNPSRGSKPFAKSRLYRRGEQRSFTGLQLDQVAFPLGGIGAGQINLGGSGQLQDFSIFNKPAFNEQARGFATIYAKPKGGKSTIRVIQGPVTHSRIFNGGRVGGPSVPEGFPHMKKAVFRGEFPFAYIDFSDPSVPLDISLEAYSPFIPLDVKNSAIPGGVLKYTFKNPTKQVVEAQFAYNMQSPFPRLNVPLLWMFSRRDGNINETRRDGNLAALYYTNTDLKPGHPNHGSFVLAMDDKDAIVQETWYMGPSAVFILWKELAASKFKERNVPPPAKPDAKPFPPQGGGVGVSFKLKPGESRTVPIIISWHIPDADAHHDVPKDEIEKWEQETGLKAEEAPAKVCADGSPATAGCGCGASPNPIKWRPYYTKHFGDAFDVAKYLYRNSESLEARTRRFHDHLFDSSFPSVVLDAVSANLGILKSPTCLLLDNGHFWAYEGSSQNRGCCTGTCTHVWNYAQAIPHLFPELERSIRSTELEKSMFESGWVAFRAKLPIGQIRESSMRHPASDGQLGGIMKVWREWHISGDDEWLRRFYPLAKKSLDYCIGAWDPDHRGMLSEMHHNTYDIEFWGPDSMCTSFYLGALRAASEMAKYLGIEKDAREYAELADRGLKLVNKELYNGEYYFQKVQWKDLHTNYVNDWRNANMSDEERELTEREGPPYQYGKGCLSDGVIGQWFTELFGLPDALDRAKTRKHLESVFKYNFKADLSEHANAMRPGYALNDEAGLVLCTWPKGGELSIPFFYAPEVWTGIEYQVASHMILHGMVDEALTIVQAVRDRYEGFIRNPWNEIECGSYYARALAVYGVFTALSGFRYSAVTKELRLDPKLPDNKMTSFFSTNTGWGRFTITRTGGKISLNVEMDEGHLYIARLDLPFETKSIKRPIPVKLAGATAKTTSKGAGSRIQVSLSEPFHVAPNAPLNLKIG